MYKLIETEGKKATVLFSGTDKQAFRMAVWTHEKEYHLPKEDRKFVNGVETIVIDLRVKRGEK